MLLLPYEATPPSSSRATSRLQPFCYFLLVIIWWFSQMLFVWKANVLIYSWWLLVYIINVFYQINVMNEHVWMNLLAQWCLQVDCDTGGERTTTGLLDPLTTDYSLLAAFYTLTNHKIQSSYGQLIRGKTWYTYSRNQLQHVHPVIKRTLCENFTIDGLESLSCLEKTCLWWVFVEILASYKDHLMLCASWMC